MSLDDSGKLNNREKYLVYAGLFITDKKELERFKALYKNIRNTISKKDIYKDVEELKGHTLQSKDRLRLLRFIHRYSTAGLVVNNSQIQKQDILFSKNAKGRYRDYVIKLLIKDIIIYIKINFQDGNLADKLDNLYNLMDFNTAKAVNGALLLSLGFKPSPLFSEIINETAFLLAINELKKDNIEEYIKTRWC